MCRKKYRSINVTLSILVFAVLALLTFALVMFLTRPTATDRAVEVRLKGVSRASGSASGSAVSSAEFLKRSRLSEIEWLDKVLQRAGWANRVALLLAQAESPWSVSAVLLASTVLGAMGFAIARYWIPDLLPALVLAVLATGLPTLVLCVLRSRRMNKFNQNLPDALDLMSRSLRAGHSVSAAIEIVSEEGSEPLRSEFAKLHRQLALGMPNREALLQLGL